MTSNRNRPLKLIYDTHMNLVTTFLAKYNQWKKGEISLTMKEFNALFDQNVLLQFVVQLKNFVYFFSTFKSGKCSHLSSSWNGLINTVKIIITKEMRLMESVIHTERVGPSAHRYSTGKKAMFVNAPTILNMKKSEDPERRGIGSFVQGMSVIGHDNTYRSHANTSKIETMGNRLENIESILRITTLPKLAGKRQRQIPLRKKVSGNSLSSFSSERMNDE